MRLARRTRTGSRPPPRRLGYRPRVEPLEDRRLPSVQVLATLGEAAAGAGFRINDFEPSAVNNRGDVLYGDDLGTTSDPSSFYGEGIFLRDKGRPDTLLARSNAPAPGGGAYDFSFLGSSALN